MLKVLEGQSAEPQKMRTVRLEPSTRSNRRERRLWHDPQQPTKPLGCSVCPDQGICGGLRVAAPFFDCLQYCCGSPRGCDRVCRNHPDYVNRVREVGTFDLETIPRSPALDVPRLPTVVPMIYHRSSRYSDFAAPAIALPMFRMFHRRDGKPCFASHESLCNAFRIRRDATIMLSGTARDAPLERWWGLGEARRRLIIRAMKGLGIQLLTTPNYSLFTDRPRHDDLHAIKRIGIIHQEFLSEGLPAALHVNGRTDNDFYRWTAFLKDRPEITHIAYEFTTGTGWANRQQQHAAWLVELAEGVNRPLHLIVRGGQDVHGVLDSAFSATTILETSVFMKTMKRKRAMRQGSGGISWVDAPSEHGDPVDDLLAENWRTIAAPSAG